MLNKIKQNSKIYKFTSLIYRYPELLSFKKRYLANNEIVLVGTPLHKNLGDHLIAAAELQFLKDIFTDKDILEIPTEVFLRYEEFIRNNINPNSKVFITGGGWMGSLWPQDEQILQAMVDAFKQCELTILPQTIFYEQDDAIGQKLLNSLNKLTDSCSDLLLCTRNFASYEFARQNISLDASRIVLAPDMGLYYRKNNDFNYNKHSFKTPHAGFYLRKDREKTGVGEKASALSVLFKIYGIDSYNRDTMYRKLIPLRKRNFLIDDEISVMKASTVIVTDRLHAMIYAALADTKCIAFNNKTGKIYGVYSQWLKSNRNILFLNRLDSVTVNTIEHFTEEEKTSFNVNEMLHDDFEELKQTIIRRGQKQ